MSEWNNMTDEQLVKLCLQGNASAQERLYNLFAQKMWTVCLRYMKNEEEAQDVLRAQIAAGPEDLQRPGAQQ